MQDDSETDLGPDEVDASVIEKLAEIGKYHQAQKRLDDALRSYPNSLALALCQGQIHYFAGRHHDAVTAFREYLTRDPDSATARIYLADSLVRWGKAKEGVELYDSLIREFPDNTALRSSRLSAWWFELRRDQVDVERELQNCLREDPDDLVSWIVEYSLAHACGSKDRMEEAVRQIQRIEPDSEAAALVLAEHMARLPSPDLESIRSLIGRFPGQPDLLRMAARAKTSSMLLFRPLKWGRAYISWLVRVDRWSRSVSGPQKWFRMLLVNVGPFVPFLLLPGGVLLALTLMILISSPFVFLLLLRTLVERYMVQRGAI